MTTWAVRGAECVCIHDSWFNLLGERSLSVHKNMILTVSERHTFVGLGVMLGFDQTPPGLLYHSSGFRPITRSTSDQDLEMFLEIADAAGGGDTAPDDRVASARAAVR